MIKTSAAHIDFLSLFSFHLFFVFSLCVFSSSLLFTSLFSEFPAVKGCLFPRFLSLPTSFVSRLSNCLFIWFSFFLLFFLFVSISLFESFSLTFVEIGFLIFADALCYTFSYMFYSLPFNQFVSKNLLLF